MISIIDDYGLEAATAGFVEALGLLLTFLVGHFGCSYRYMFDTDFLITGGWYRYMIAVVVGTYRR